MEIWTWYINIARKLPNISLYNEYHFNFGGTNKTQDSIVTVIIISVKCFPGVGGNRCPPRSNTEMLTLSLQLFWHWHAYVALFFTYTLWVMIKIRQDKARPWYLPLLHYRVLFVVIAIVFKHFVFSDVPYSQLLKFLLHS